MNITRSELAAQYATARKLGWAPLAHAEERRRGFPHYTLFAVYSRETNMGRAWIGGRLVEDYYITHPGDNGHGRGLGQVDDRSHTIPPDWATNLSWQISESAAILDGAYRRCGSWAGGFAAYNSGRCSDVYTTGGDYGTDVTARRHALLEIFGPPRRKGHEDMPQAFVNVEVDPRGAVYFEKAEAVVRVFSDNVGKPKAGGGFDSKNGCTVRVAIIAEDGEVLAVEQVWATTKFEGQQWTKPAGKAGFVWCVGLGPNDYGIAVDYVDDDG